MAYIILVIKMLINIIINSFLKNMTTEKAILISKQFCIDFNHEEMNIILPYIKNNWQMFLSKNKKTSLLEYISNKTCLETAKKAELLMNKLLIIFS